MCARSFKNLLRKQLRETVRKVQVPSIESDRQVILTLLNSLLLSDNFWQDTLLPYLSQKFPHSLSIDELEGFNKNSIFKEKSSFMTFITRFQTLSGIKLSQKTYEEFLQSNFEIIDLDIEVVAVKTKFMVGNFLEISHVCRTLLNMQRRWCVLHKLKPSLAECLTNCTTWQMPNLKLLSI